MAKKMTLLALVFMVIATIIQLIRTFLSYQQEANMRTLLVNVILVLVFMSIIKTLVDLIRKK